MLSNESLGAPHSRAPPEAIGGPTEKSLKGTIDFSTRKLRVKKSLGPFFGYTTPWPSDQPPQRLEPGAVPQPPPSGLRAHSPTASARPERPSNRFVTTRNFA